MARFGCAVLGAYAGVLGVVIHRQRDLLGAWTVPWGLIVAFVLAALVAASAAHLADLGAAWAGAGWASVVLLVQLGRDVLVGGDVIGWTFMLGSLALFAVMAWRTADRNSGSTS